MYVPDYLARSIEDIDFKLLARNGVKYVAFDADSTLVPHRGVKIAPSTLKFLRSQRSLFKAWCIATNRFTNDLQPLANSIGAPIIQASLIVRKPQRRFFKRVLRYFGAKPHEVAMVGDKLIADVVGGNRSGLKTVWVEILGSDSFMSRLTGWRRWERRMLKRFKNI